MRAALSFGANGKSGIVGIRTLATGGKERADTPLAVLAVLCRRNISAKLRAGACTQAVEPCPATLRICGDKDAIGWRLPSPFALPRRQQSEAMCVGQWTLDLPRWELRQSWMRAVVGSAMVAHQCGSVGSRAPWWYAGSGTAVVGALVVGALGVLMVASGERFRTIVRPCFVGRHADRRVRSKSAIE